MPNGTCGVISFGVKGGKEAAAKFQKPIATAKTIYDCASLLLSLCLSLAFFGSVQGIGIGTVICAILNGMLIQFFTKATDTWANRQTHFII